MTRLQRGPVSLGRSVLVNPGDDTPNEWLNVQRLKAEDILNAWISDSTEARDLRSFLRQSWMERISLVIEILPELGNFEVPSHPSWSFQDDENFIFYIYENAVNVLNPNAPKWWAKRLGRELGGEETAGNEPGDLKKRDGSNVWLDGGPFNLRALRAENGIPVIPRIHMKQRELIPLNESQQVDIQLDPEQRQAVGANGGPIRIIAPAGSGKTRVLTERINFLVASGVNPNCITAIAYNTRARDEMRNRLNQIERGRIKTFHGLAYQLISAYRDNVSKPKVLNEINVRAILERIVPAGARRANTDRLEPWVDAVAYCRDALLDPNEIPGMFPELRGGDFQDVFEKYLEVLQSKNLVDFPQMITLASKFLSEDRDFREATRAKIGLLLVDEFQDLTPSLARLTKLIANPSDDVFCVGDDDQTIYSFTGASPKYLVEFDDLFPGANFFALETNYRCPPIVIDSVNNLLSHNFYRVGKTINPPNNGRNDESVIEHEILFSISSKIQNQIDSGVNINDICVLSRTNAALIVPYFLLSLNGIPVTRPRGIDKKFLRRTGIASVLAWLDIANNRISPESLESVIKRPRRDISPKLLQVIIGKSSLEEIDIFMSSNTNSKMRESMSGFVADGKNLIELTENGATTEELMKVILDDIGVGDLISGIDKSQRTSRKNSHRDQLEALQYLSRLEPDPREFASFVSRTLSMEQEGSEPAILLETIHRAKGLEWPHVHLFNVSENLFPHTLAESIEEERRLFHVGITRCQNSLTLYYESQSQSPFIEELEVINSSELFERLDERIEAESSASAASVVPNEYDEDLFGELKSWRLETARSERVPAFIVFSDRVLREIAKKRPTSLSELSRVNGVGPAKLEKYGSEVIEIVRPFT